MNTHARRTARSLGFAISFALLTVLAGCGDDASQSDELNAGQSDAALHRHHHPWNFCGNKVCDHTETCSTCPTDCGACALDAGVAVGSDAGGAADAGGLSDASSPPPPPTKYNFYVATTGSDSNAGTQAAPFRTILKASQAALPDSTVHVAPGTYLGGFQTTKSGTAAGRIRYVSDTRWGAKIVPPSSSSSDTGWDNRGAYVTIDGFEVDGSVDPSSGTLWAVGINVAGTGDIVTNCHAHHIFNSGTASGQGGAGILLDSWYGYNDMQALGNVVHHSGPTSGGGNWYHGIYQTATGVIKNNVVYANAGGGIHLWHDANHIDVANNTSFGNGDGFIVGGGDFVNTSGPCDYITVTNNIAFDNSNLGFDEEGQCGSHNLFANNLSFQNGTNWRLNFSSHSNDVTADPQFVSYARTGGGNYRLKSSSPAIDHGSSTYAPLTDFDGSLRPYGAAVDLGAFEWRP